MKRGAKILGQLFGLQLDVEQCFLGMDKVGYLEQNLWTPQHIL